MTVFRDRYRIDVQTRTPGLRFEDAWEDRVEMKFGEMPFYHAAKRNVIASQRAAGRKIDLEDVHVLESS